MVTGNVSLWLQFLFSGLTAGSMYALIAVSLVIVYQTSVLICFAQGEFFVIGALTMISLVAKGLPMGVAFLLTVILAAILGATLERLLIRPIRNSGIGNLIVMTVAISLTLRGSALVIWGKESEVLPPFTSGSPLQVLGATLQLQVLWIIGVTLISLLLIWFFFERTTTGIAMRACAENRLGASLMGIGTNKMIILSWAWGAGIGAIAGMAMAPILFIQYGSGVAPMVKGFIAMSIGGLASIAGAVIAGYLLGILEAFTIGMISSQYSDPIVFGLLIAVLIWKPEGLFGARRGREI